MPYPSNSPQPYRDPYRDPYRGQATGDWRQNQGGMGGAAPPFMTPPIYDNPNKTGIANQEVVNPLQGGGDMTTRKPQNIMNKWSGFFSKNPFLQNLRQRPRGAGGYTGRNPAQYGAVDRNSPVYEQDPYASSGNSGQGNAY